MTAPLTLLTTPQEAAAWLKARITGTLTADSRQVRAGDGFIAWPGAATDGRKFVAGALATGAAACLVEAEGSDVYGFDSERVAAYAGLKAATAPIAAACFGHPSNALSIAAVTGTNGKTSTAWWLAQALTRVDLRCGVVGTLGVGEPGAMVFNGLTTPDPVLLQQQFRRFVEAGFQACAIEASSIGVAERRLDATSIDVAVFTNFTQDHLDYHADMASYWQAKSALFDWPGLNAAVVNIDDAKGAELAASLLGRMDVWTVSCTGPARLQATAIAHGAGTLAFDVSEAGEPGESGISGPSGEPGSAGQRHRLQASVVGQYNVSNLLGVLGALRAFGVSLADAVQACTGLSPVPGRTETVAQPGQPLVVIDYAHTPDALEKVLTALQPTARSRSGRLWCVFGCGGDRDASKRPLMAAAAERHADRIVVTSDNPRSEAPLAIIDQILAGFSDSHGIVAEADRAEAIAMALAQAGADDVVLLAGKGAEDYQDIGGIKRPFSDRTQAEAALKTRQAGRVAA